jgi:hypothetical protein
MNNKTMQRIAEKVLLQMESEKLMNVETGKLLDINPGYLSIIKKPDQYDKCPMKAWRKMHVWYNSGSSLRDYDWRKAPEEPNHTEPIMEETPIVRRSAPPKPEPTPEEGKPPTEEKPEPSKEENTVTVPASLEIRKHVFHPEKPKGKPGRKKDEGKPGRPSQEEIERVLATLGIEIAIVVKHKNKQD